MAILIAHQFGDPEKARVIEEISRILKLNNSEEVVHLKLLVRGK